jgi:hypothetical protein
VDKIPHVSTGELLTRWTVRLALALYAATVALRLASPAHPRLARGLWTAGCLLFLAHVAAAFTFFHGWSHAHAYGATARQTFELFGIDWGGGLYFNYLFTAAWIADVAYWWAAGLDAYERRSPAVGLALHSFFAFMAFNGAVVFAKRPTRWVALAVTVLLGLFALHRLRRRRQRRSGGPG